VFRQFGPAWSSLAARRRSIQNQGRWPSFVPTVWVTELRQTLFAVGATPRARGSRPFMGTTATGSWSSPPSGHLLAVRPPLALARRRVEVVRRPYVRRRPRRGVGLGRRQSAALGARLRLSRSSVQQAAPASPAPERKPRLRELVLWARARNSGLGLLPLEHAHRPCPRFARYVDGCKVPSLCRCRNEAVKNAPMRVFRFPGRRQHTPATHRGAPRPDAAGHRRTAESRAARRGNPIPGPPGNRRGGRPAPGITGMPPATASPPL